ncbi:CHASE domain-containing protein [Pricia sp. S334]|uniref:histidine kinase n=1 Tax=Pricia mediterranea TaxID=3076079 RepID=A0ABU3L5K9_9FLAO|nr:CHASE domain-containing protein [Pricia sp. S334]MDT7829019.1 CHASE domain-containing protein [Pricia sp. S334]
MTKGQLAKYAAVKVLGTALSIFIFYSINKTYQDRNKATVENAVAKAELKLGEELNKINLVIESMAFYYENTSEVSQTLFERFTNPFLRELNGIRALEWAPRIEDSTEDDFERLTVITKTNTLDSLVVSTARGVHYPIQVLNPLTYSQKAIGYDLYSDDTRRKAIDRAIRTEKVALTGPITLILNDNDVPGVLALKSVSDTISNQTKGVVAAVYRMDDLIGNTLASELNVLDICIHDETSDVELLYSSFGDTTPEALANRSINGRINAVDRLWDIHYIPKSEYLAFPHVFESYVVLILGLISTILLTYTVKRRDEYNDRLEARVRLRTSELEASNELKENLLREIHHRVKNNLQITSSLMNMQKRKLFSAEAVTALSDSQARISAIALTHQKIYQDKDSKAVNLSDYLNDLMEHQKKMSYSFSYKIECPEISIDLDNAVPLALIISELVTNALKHAYPDTTQYNELLIHVERLNPEKVSLSILDNGKGLPKDFNIEKAEGIGFEIIRALCRQISAKLSYESNGGGTQFNLVFPNKT